MHELSKNAFYICKAEFGLSDFDREMLFDCYLPLFSADAVILYEFFIRQSKNNDEMYIFDDLPHLFGTNVQNVNNSLRKMEALGLISTYRLEDRNSFHYIFKLYPPLSPSDFFHNPLLNSLLESKLGKRRMMEIKMKYRADADIPDDYTDISAKFADVFDVTPDYSELMNYSGHTLNLKAKEYQEMRPEISLGKFQEELNALGVDFAIVKNDIDRIYDVCSVYGLNEKDASELISEAIDSYNQFNFDVFKNNASNYYNFHINEEDEHRDGETFAIGSSLFAKRLREAQKEYPQQFLQNLLKTNKLPKSYNNLIYTMKSEYGVDDTLINILNDYTLQVCNGQLPDQYVIKTWLSLKHEKIDNPQDAMAFLYQNRREMFDKKKNKKTAKKEKDEEHSENLEENEKNMQTIADLNIDEILGE
ncbi:MAG: hypothetical protein PHW22_04225 [Bacilli bacterium]|nr:hypothetical protein [Bacilli bacterium]